jgi:hypothetical protein
MALRGLCLTSDQSLADLQALQAQKDLTSKQGEDLLVVGTGFLSKVTETF